MQEPNENNHTPLFPTATDLDTLPLIGDEPLFLQMHTNNAFDLSNAAPYVTPQLPYNLMTTPSLDRVSQILTPLMPFNATNTPALDSVLNNFMSPAMPLIESPLNMQLDPFSQFHGTPYQNDPLIPSNFTYNWVHQTFDNTAPLIGTPFLGFAPYPSHALGSLASPNLDFFTLANQFNSDWINGSPFLAGNNGLPFGDTTPIFNNTAVNDVGLGSSNFYRDLTPLLDDIKEENPLDSLPLFPATEPKLDSLFPKPDCSEVDSKANDSKILIEQLVRGTTFSNLVDGQSKTTQQPSAPVKKGLPELKLKENQPEPKKMKLELLPPRKIRMKSNSSDTIISNTEAEGGDASELKLKKFRCDFPGCNLSFTRLYNMKTHQITHDANRVRRFPCPTCKRGFDRKHDLMRHIKALHEKEEEEQCEGVTIR